MSTPTSSPQGTATTHGARDHARAMAGTVVDAMPTLPPSAATELPAGVAPADVLWDEVVAGGGYTAVRAPPGRPAAADRHRRRRLRRAAAAPRRPPGRAAQRGRHGEGAVAGLPRRRVAAAVGHGSGAGDHRRGHLGPPRRLLRHHDRGRPTRPATATAPPTGRAPTGATTSPSRWPSTGSPVATSRRTSTCSRGSTVEPDGALGLRRPAPARHPGRAAGRAAAARDDRQRPPPARPQARPTRSRPLRVTAWRGAPAPPDDPARTATPEATRAYRQHRARRCRRDRSVVHDEVVRARAPWSRVVEAGQTLRIVDVGGNQAVDCVLFDAHDPVERYSAPDTMAAQGNVFLVTGTVLLLHRGQPDDDHHRVPPASATTPSAGPARRSPTPSATGSTPAPSTPASRTSCTSSGRHGLGKRDLQSNINWFMNVPVDPDGTLGIVDGISAPGPVGRPAGRARRARGGVELPPDQQPLQRLRPHPRADGRDRSVSVPGSTDARRWTRHDASPPTSRPRTVAAARRAPAGA